MEHPQDEQTTHKLTQILSPDFTFTKRQLGIALALVGSIAFLGILGLDVIGGGREGGIGPAQTAALVVMALLTLVGFSLIPLGDDPA
ncbi:MAG: hypothetical protein WBC91_17925 [Phototrophicaceae bacterium]